ncbi:MAG TPA: NAD(P)-binding domain-containing protein, partial [Xanthobacteraceae bacterium]|nr:NAD(P)-binding domain-containing protein [Xanthobacteraceae bacterium]
MKAGFIGLGRMGQAMARRILDAGHQLGVYNRTAEKLRPLIDLGAEPLGSIDAAANYGEAVFTMLADDAAVTEVASKPGGLIESLPQGGIHICAGTHSVACIAILKELHGSAGQVLLATPMLGRPEVVLSGQAGMVLAGADKSLDRCRPLFDAIARRTFAAGRDPVAAAAIKI